MIGRGGGGFQNKKGTELFPLIMYNYLAEAVIDRKHFLNTMPYDHVHVNPAHKLKPNMHTEFVLDNSILSKSACVGEDHMCGSASPKLDA